MYTVQCDAPKRIYMYILCLVTPTTVIRLFVIWQISLLLKMFKKRFQHIWRICDKYILHDNASESSSEKYLQTRRWL